MKHAIIGYLLFAITFSLGSNSAVINPTVKEKEIVIETPISKDVQTLVKTMWPNKRERLANFKSIVRGAKELNIPYEDFTKLIYLENGGDIRKPNPNSNAKGIIHFLPSTCEYLGFKHEDLDKMSFNEQMDKAIQFFRKTGVLHKVKDFNDLYFACFHPAAVGKGHNYIIGMKGHDAYNHHAYMDTNNSNTLTSCEVIKSVTKRLDRVLN